MSGIVAGCIAIIVALLMTINAVFMLASPRAWFHLPGWLRAQGSLSADKYSSGWGAVQVRLTGALILATIAWVLNNMFLTQG